MKSYLDCTPCFMQQALRAGRMSTDNESEIQLILRKTAKYLQTIEQETTPAENSLPVYNIIKEVTGVADPYKKIKAQSIDQALKLLPELRLEVKNSDDPLLTAIRIAIAGNVIDFGVDKSFNLTEDVQKILKQDFAILHYRAFKQELEQAKSVLYIGDNAGETVLDRLLIETISKPVTFVVREKPIINDAVYADAVASGLDESAKIISSGSPAAGTILSLCTDDFVKRFNNADLVISKGQGNYEGLSNVNRSVFFLLKAKCPVIAKDLNVPEDSIILANNR
ncbi:MAG: ARMT1-like domain-containing protein [Bacteroidota bacterium]|nr:ARMT1-like domain-containing protein [Bacteroidota bacterium]